MLLFEFDTLQTVGYYGIHPKASGSYAVQGVSAAYITQVSAQYVVVNPIYGIQEASTKRHISTPLTSFLMTDNLMLVT